MYTGFTIGWKHVKNTIFLPIGIESNTIYASHVTISGKIITIIYPPFFVSLNEYGNGGFNLVTSTDDFTTRDASCSNGRRCRS